MNAAALPRAGCGAPAAIVEEPSPEEDGYGR